MARDTSPTRRDLARPSGVEGRAESGERDVRRAEDPSGAAVVLPFPRGRVEPARHFRSTWIVSSLEGIRRAGHFDRYRAALRAHHDAILSAMPGMWLPMAVAAEHYRACSELGLTPEQHAAMTRGAGGHTRQAWFADLIAAAEQTDATPWSILPLLHRMWLQGADGGAVAIFRLAASRARVDYVGCELFAISYFREATGIMIAALTSRVRENASVSVLPVSSTAATATECSCIVAW